MNENKLEVFYHDRQVGTLSETNRHQIAFAYSAEWMKNGFPISPFSLPVQDGVFLPPNMHFGGLFGVFSDSLPDAWGQLLMRRMFDQHGISQDEVGQLTRLAVIGDSGMGALQYHPVWRSWKREDVADLDVLAEECQQLLKHEKTGDADKMFALAGSSGGARPKIMTDEWIIKFPSSREDAYAGLMEKEYMDCAARCGIVVPETRLLPSNRCGGYFAVRRFDRKKGDDGTVERSHMMTVAALLELDRRSPGLDYRSLMKLTKILCRDRKDETEQMYRRMCFNVFAHNRDDHSKNFSFLYDEGQDRWKLSPAYDLTWSNTYYGEHTTTVNGNGRNPGLDELVNVGKSAGLPSAKCRKTALEIQEITVSLVARFGK